MTSLRPRPVRDRWAACSVCGVDESAKVVADRSTTSGSGLRATARHLVGKALGTLLAEFAWSA